MKDERNFVWLDLEMTGLDPVRDKILEIATVITSPDLRILADGPVIAVYQPDVVLESMDQWSAEQHQQSGLLDRVRKSPHSTRAAEEETLAFVKQWVNRKEAPLCGNSIWHDRRFLVRHMPELESYFHYRIIDVSTIKELAIRWAPELVYVNTEKKHRALEDIHDSITELRHYSQCFIHKHRR